MSRVEQALRRAGLVQPPVDRLEVHIGARLQHYAREAGTAPANLQDQRAGRIAHPPSGNSDAIAAPPAAAPALLPLSLSRVLDPAFRRKSILGEAPATVVEQFRRLAVAIHELHVEQGLRMLVITSTLPDEGKTLTAVNLALTLSESCLRRVLLIDADLRRPFIHQVFQLPNDRGLASALMAGDDNGIVPVKVSQNLSVLPAGQIDQPMALASDRLSGLLERWAASTEIVLIDAPPVGVVPDAQLLARLTQAVLFVIAAHRTPQALVTRAITEIGQEFVIGTVLNEVDEHDIPAADYYNHYGRLMTTTALDAP